MQTGQCFVEVPESAYDADYFGLIMRRIVVTVGGILDTAVKRNMHVLLQIAKRLGDESFNRKVASKKTLELVQRVCEAPRGEVNHEGIPSGPLGVRMPQDLLSIDSERELKKTDKFINTLLGDERAQKRFFDNPARVMGELKINRSRTKEEESLANKIFYLTLSNKRWLRYCADSIPKFKIPEKSARRTAEILNQDRVGVDPQVKKIVTAAYLKNEKILRQMFLLTLRDLNRHGVFSKRHPDNQIKDYVERLLVQIRRRRPLRERRLAYDGPVCEPVDVEGPVCFPSDAIIDAAGRRENIL